MDDKAREPLRVIQLPCEEDIERAFCRFSHEFKDASDDCAKEALKIYFDLYASLDWSVEKKIIAPDGNRPFDGRYWRLRILRHYVESNIRMDLFGQILLGKFREIGRRYRATTVGDKEKKERFLQLAKDFEKKYHK